MAPQASGKSKGGFPSGHSGDGATDFATGTLRYAMWTVLKQAQDEGFPSLRVEEIFRRTKGSKSAELGYYDWSKSKTPLNSISSTATSCVHFMKVGSYQIALNDGKPQKMMEGRPGGMGASAKFKGQKVDPRAKGKAKAVTKAGRGASKPVYESTFPYSSRNGSVPGSPVSKKRKGVDLSPPPAAQRQLSPRSIAMMSSSPSQAVGLGLGAGPNTPVDAATGWPAGLSPLAPISPVITWDEASAAGRCTVADAVMAHDALGRWPLDEPVVCGDKRGALLGCSLVRCTCSVCEATTPEGCLFPLALWEKHATLRRNASSSIVHAATQLPLPQWLTAQAVQLEGAQVRGKRLRVYWVTSPAVGIQGFRSGSVVSLEEEVFHTVRFDDGCMERMVLPMEWVEWESGWSPPPLEQAAPRVVSTDGDTAVGSGGGGPGRAKAARMGDGGMGFVGEVGSATEVEDSGSALMDGPAFGNESSPGLLQLGGMPRMISEERLGTHCLDTTTLGGDNPVGVLEVKPALSHSKLDEREEEDAVSQSKDDEDHTLNGTGGRKAAAAAQPPVMSHNKPVTKVLRESSRTKAKTLEWELANPDAALLKKMMNLVDKNAEAYKQGEWERVAWQVRQYTKLTDYAVADDPALKSAEAAEIASFLTTSKHGGCNGEHCQDPNQPPGTYRDGEFVSQCACMAAATECDAHCRCVADKCRNRAVSMKNGLTLSHHVFEQSLWGLDCYTRANVTAALSLCEGFSDAASQMKFVESWLLPAINAMKEQGWDILLSLEEVQRKAAASSDPDAPRMAKVAATLHRLIPQVEATAAARVQKNKDKKAAAAASGVSMAEAMGGGAEADEPGSNGSGDGEVKDKPLERSFFRVHPKGVGVICKAPEGIEPETFVTEYYGELYPPWRWFEKQDAIKKCNPGMALPEFYNITIERPRDDDAGYGVLFVDASVRGGFGSRLSHSCTPNCQTVVLSCNGKVTIAMRTIRRVEYGEELTWDYACVTESEREYRSAICLCGTVKCRGSFLYYSNSSSFTAVMSTRHTFVDRNALLMRAGAEAVTPEDEQRLHRHGLRSHALCPKGVPLPSWLVKWAALVLEYIELEVEQLPRGLLALPGVDGGPKPYADMDHAILEAKGVGENRLQNLTITLNKIAYVIEQGNTATSHPPLRALTDDEVVQHLWTGDNSIAQRVVARATAALCPACSKKPAPSSWRTGGGTATHTEKCADARAMQQLLDNTEPTLANVSQGLRKLSAHLRACGSAYVAAADLCWLYGHTQHWCTPGKQPMVLSKEVPLREDEMAGTTAALREDKLQKKYRPGFLWGQLVSWFKQTIYDPSASLSADRRGSMSLPDPESAFSIDSRYVSKERKALLSNLEKAPSHMWPTGTIWSFQNQAKIYGSPMLDDAIRQSKGLPTTLATVLEGLHKPVPKKL